MYPVPPLNPPRGSSSPFVYAENVFNEEQLNYIDQLVDSLDLTDGGTVEYNENYRKSLVAFVDHNPDTEWLFAILTNVVHQLNANYYRFNLSVLDTIQYAFYDADFDGKYDWHHDYNEGPTPARKLTVVVQLSDPSDYEGGQLEIFPEVEVPKKRGMVCMFPSYLYHRVTPVLSGTRKVLVAWIWGPPFA
mgnify:CR=1 FL=1|tara:strand:- start:2470 stop:3039 length:570 start_codon:yes stop_codon:yes gene_type:complete